MNLRGQWATLPEEFEDAVKVNVTSAQGKENANRLAFSPMTPIPGRYKGMWCFENYWQSLKVFEDIPPEKVQTYFRSLHEAKRRYPGSKGKRVLYALTPDGQKLDYIQSRKQVYVPEYYQLIKGHNLIQRYQKMHQLGRNIAIYDFDGPRTVDGGVTFEVLDAHGEMLRKKINDPSTPFGHGYIVAATIAGIDPTQYS